MKIRGHVLIAQASSGLEGVLTCTEGIYGLNTRQSHFLKIHLEEFARRGYYGLLRELIIAKSSIRKLMSLPLVEVLFLINDVLLLT